jgi:hypothetical protein
VSVSFAMIPPEPGRPLRVECSRCGALLLARYYHDDPTPRVPPNHLASNACAVRAYGRAQEARALVQAVGLKGDEGMEMYRHIIAGVHRRLGIEYVPPHERDPLAAPWLPEWANLVWHRSSMTTVQRTALLMLVKDDTNRQVEMLAAYRLGGWRGVLGFIQAMDVPRDLIMEAADIVHAADVELGR